MAPAVPDPDYPRTPTIASGGTVDETRAAPLPRPRSERAAAGAGGDLRATGGETGASLACPGDTAPDAPPAPWWAARSTPDLGPPGQLALLGEAQRGLDGRFYASSPAQPATETPEGSSRSLGPHTEFRAERETEVPAAGRRAVQLDMFDRLDVARGLLSCRCPDGSRSEQHRDRARHGECFDRQAKCYHVRRLKADEPVRFVRSASGHLSVIGVVQCGHATCSVCGPKLHRAAAAAIGAGMRAWLWAEQVRFPEDNVGPGWKRGHDVAMLSPTVPHRGLTAGESVQFLFETWERFCRSSAWRRWSARWGVVAHPRVLDGTWSENTYEAHPHFHVALFLENAWIVEPSRYRYKQPPMRGAGVDRALEDWLEDELRPHTLAEGEYGPRYAVPALACSQPKRELWLRELLAELVPAWVAAVKKGTALDERQEKHVRDHGLELTPAEHAESYFTKWGLADEVAKSSTKADSPARLLDRQAAGDDRAGIAYIAWRRAVHGRHQVAGVQDMLDAIGLDDDAVQLYADEQRRRREEELEREGKLVRVAPWDLEVREQLYPAALAVGWKLLGELVGEAVAGGGDAQVTLDRVLLDVESELRRRRYAGQLRAPPRDELLDVARNAIPSSA